MKCLRIHADEAGVSHFADIDIPLIPMELFPGVPPLHLSEMYPASSVRFGWVPAGLGAADWHNAPAPQLVVWLTGWVEFETSDGEVRRCDAGTVVLAEDIFGKGHLSRHPDEGQFFMMVPLPDGITAR
jgi:hypothetical protein